MGEELEGDRGDWGVGYEFERLLSVMSTLKCRQGKSLSV